MGEWKSNRKWTEWLENIKRDEDGKVRVRIKRDGAEKRAKRNKTEEYRNKYTLLSLGEETPLFKLREEDSRVSWRGEGTVIAIVFPQQATKAQFTRPARKKHKNAI